VTALRAALVTPVSGPLAAFGLAGATALRLWSEAAHLPPPWTTVDLELFDAHPSAGAAMRTAIATAPDTVFGPYGSGPAVAAIKATHRLVWNHGGATDRLRWPEFPNVLNLLAPALSYFAAVLRAVVAREQSVRSVSLLHAATGFGREVARGALETAAQLGLQVQMLEFAPGQVSEACSRLPHGEVLLVVGPFADELEAAVSLLDRPWRRAAFVAAGVDEVLEPLGRSREGLLGPCQWLARATLPSEEGPDATWFVEAYRKATGREPPYPAAAAYAAGVLYTRCVRDAGSTDEESIIAAASRLDIRTLFGSFHLDPATGLQAGHQVLVVQWQQGVRRVVWPSERAEQSLA
jgi:branched-chain amino acid transport system substrate-binding protein